jgi:hypothetical protein
MDATVDRAHMADFDPPTHDWDVEREEGIPEGARRLREHLVEGAMHYRPLTKQYLECLGEHRNAANDRMEHALVEAA